MALDHTKWHDLMMSPLRKLAGWARVLTQFQPSVMQMLLMTPKLYVSGAVTER
jgi:hypothetical protein